MAALDPGNIPGSLHLYTCRSKARGEPGVVAACERGMRFPGRPEILLHAQVNLHLAALEPAAAAFGKLARLRNFAHAENAGVKAACAFLLAWRHGELHVLNGDE